MKAMKSDPVKTCLTISTGFLLIHMTGIFGWALWTALLCGLIGILSKPLALQIEKIWMGLAKLLSYIVPNIVMGVVFFGILLPLSLLSGLFRKTDALQRKNPEGSVFTDSHTVYDKAHFENMW